MKKLFLIISTVCVVMVTGCNKYLDKEPDNRTIIKTPDQVAQLLTSAYPKANYIPFCESMSDNAEDKGGGGSNYDFLNKINTQSYRYEIVEESPDAQDGPDYYWTAAYKAIAAANMALKIINEMPDKSALGPHMGEAYLARAYAHFMLVTLFSKAYDPATAASDPGIPYVTEPETKVFVTYDRKTVAYVYEMIEKDLLAGYPLIDERIYGTAPKFHFNKKAAAAFAARFFLFKKDYANTILYASDALKGPVAENLRPWNTILSNLQYYELQAEYTKSSLTGNLLLQEANTFWGSEYPSVRYGLGESVGVELIFNRNVTGGIYAYPLYGAGPTSFNIPKFYEQFVPDGINANTGQPFNTIPLFTAEEALLNRAEAYLFMNNNSAALADLNAFISKNIDSYNAGTHNLSASKASNYYGMPAGPALLNATIDFKRAFFLHEGMRWFDIIRLKIPVLHITKEGEQIYLSPEDNRRVLQLPALTKQAGLEPNPR